MLNYLIGQTTDSRSWAQFGELVGRGDDFARSYDRFTTVNRVVHADRYNDIIRDIVAAVANVERCNSLALGVGA